MPQPRRIRSLLACVTVTIAVVAAACGGPVAVGTSAPASGPPIATTPATAPRPAGSPAAFTPDKSVDLAIVLETNTTVEKVIPVEGGSITATGADGSIYTLDIPSDALLVETTISMTPVASMTGLPFGGDRTYAVQLGPDGLFLQNFAILTITPSSPIAVERQIVFGYLGDGEDVIHALPVPDSSEIKINVLHFSGDGVIDAPAPDGRTVLGANAERQLQNAIAETIGWERQHQLLCSLCPPTVDMEAYTVAITAAYHEQVVQVRVDAAGDSCEAGKLAVETVIGVQRQSEILGILDGPTYPGLYDKVARLCVLEEFEACVEHHRFFLMASLYLSMERQQAHAHTYSAGTMAEARDLTMKCLTFRLEFESTATDDRPGQMEYISSVRATTMLRWDPVTHLTGGISQYENTLYNMEVPDPCHVDEIPGGGRFVVLALLEHVDPGELVDGGYPDAQVDDFNLTYMPDISSESGFLICPNGFKQPMPFPAWSLAYYAAHVLETGEWAGPGLGNVDWDIKGGELFATNEWDVEKDTMTEQGSFELYHVPGE